MARIQVLELPTRHHGDEVETPFVIILDQLEGSAHHDLTDAASALKEQAGAAAVVAFDGTLDVA
ncbi:hypothetical protein ACWDRR_43790 [Kitasatospora sp. NPDC003701]